MASMTAEGSRGLAVFLGNVDAPANYRGNDYKFRQDSSFLYFWGVDEPWFAAILDLDSADERLYGNDVDIDDIIWMGPQPTVASKGVAVGCPATAPLAEFDKAVAAVVANLKEQSTEVGEDYSKVEQVGTISANNDAFIGKLIADAMSKVKKEGVITVEEAKGTATEVKVVEGMQFDRGYISPYFMTNPDKMEAVLEQPFILITDKKISSMKDLLPILEPIAREGKSLLIIAEDVDGEALTTLVLNKIRGTFTVVGVKAKIIK